MRKLCLILTVLYAFGANCSAQSLIAENLLEGNSSTFNSGWGKWEDQASHCGKSLASGEGPDGSQCARLTPKANATENFNAQLRYTFAAKKGTTYVFRLKAKKVSGNGTIQAIMQHNSGKFEQQHFFDKEVSDSWATYEGEVTAERDDYDVIMINYGKCGDVLIDDIEFGVKTDNVERAITVDNKVRKYWLYVPASVEGQKDVPVVFSLHGRYGTDDPNDAGKPLFTSLAKEKKFIVVYPQGRDGTNKADYPGDWNNGFENTTGWEATGKENADTKFIKAIVDEIKTIYNSNSNISVDPKRFYLCGFSMGGMMTYACAKVLNGTFAAYGSCSGYPLNEFHMNLATEKPIPFIHLHGNKDQMLGIKHLHTIIENLLFRNGCDLSNQVSNKDWVTTNVNGEAHHFKKYDFTSVNGAPVTTVTFDGVIHEVEASAPAYLWNFFKDKTTDMYKSDIEWKWDMPTINTEIAKSSSGDVNAFTYGWKHVINGSDRSLTYGGGGKTQCSSEKCTSANDDCDGNHNVYNSIQLTPGKHTLYAKMTSTSGEESSVTLRNILTGAETVARKVVNNSGTTQATTYNVLYEFEVGEGAEFSLELKRSNTNSACTLLEIHKGSYRPEGVKDESQDNATVNLNDGKLAELTFENVADIWSIEKPVNELTPDGKNMKLYMKSRLGSVKDGKFVNKDKYIVEDAVFGHYFQNIPDADIYDRYGASDYMRVVLGENNSLSDHDGIKGIQTTGQVTIGFWVNGNLAVNRGLAYDEPSMFYIAGNTYNGPNEP